MLRLKRLSVNTASISRSSVIVNALIGVTQSRDTLEDIRLGKCYYCRSYHSTGSSPHILACWPFKGIHL